MTDREPPYPDECVWDAPSRARAILTCLALALICIAGGVAMSLS